MAKNNPNAGIPLLLNAKGTTVRVAGASPVTNGARAHTTPIRSFATKVNIINPDGSTGIGYVIGGITYKDALGIQRIDAGTIVQTGKGLYQYLGNGKSEPYIPANITTLQRSGQQLNAYIINGKTYLASNLSRPLTGDIVHTADGLWKMTGDGSVKIADSKLTNSILSTNSQDLAKQILNNPQIILHHEHLDARGRNEQNLTSTVPQNIEDTAAGQQAQTSFYGNAPGTSTYIDARVLSSILAISDKYGTIRITALAGGSHSAKSAHYSGLAIDIDLIGGIKIDGPSKAKPQNPLSHSQDWHNEFQKFVINELGASAAYHQFYDPYGGHHNHIHIEWR